MSKKTEVEEQVQLSPEEFKTLADARMKNDIKKKCAGEIDVILKKYNARMMVNPRSPLVNLEIIIVLN